MSMPCETYHRLEEAAYLVARHPDYPGKGDVVRSCMSEIESRYRMGSLDRAQSNHLIAILMGQECPEETSDIG